MGVACGTCRRENKCVRSYGKKCKGRRAWASEA